MNKLIYLIIGICLISLVSAQEVYQVNQDSELKFTCTLNNEIPSASTEFNITVSYPNGTTLINNKQATAQGSGSFNYTTNFPVLGTYKVQMFCYDGTYSYSDEGTYKITPTGNELTTSNSIMMIFILTLLIIISIIFFIFGMAQSTPIGKIFCLSITILLIVFTIGYLLKIVQTTIGEFDILVSGFTPIYIIGIVLLGGWGIALILFLIVYSFKLFYKSRGYID